mgnify:FL=1
MAGLTNTGFTVNRMSDILTSLRAEAVQLFQDQVQPGDTVDTSDSAILGRLIGLVTPSLVDLWEAAQQDYAAFDPNSATGIALGNLAALGGLSRQGETYSSSSVILSGDNGKLVSSLTIGSLVDTSQWDLVAPVALSPSVATGITTTPIAVANSTLYTITYSSISTSNTISYTSNSSGATADNILAGIASLVGASHPTLIATIVGTNLTLTRVDEFATVSFSTSTNMGITKVQKIGEVQAVTSGPISAEPNTLTSILTPMSGLDSVTNPISATAGRNTETDEELRTRLRNTKFERASNILEALYSALINLTGVQEVRIYENDTDVTDAFGVPAHSFKPIVLGGLSSSITQAIWENKPMGIRSFGDTTVVIYDTQGFAHSIGFERPDPVPIYISMHLTTDSNYPATAESDIKSNLITFFDTNLGIGDDVIYSRLYTPINLTPGHQIDYLHIGTTASPTGTSNLVIPFDAIASLSSANIIITT